MMLSDVECLHRLVDFMLISPGWKFAESSFLLRGDDRAQSSLHVPVGFRKELDLLDS